MTRSAARATRPSPASLILLLCLAELLGMMGVFAFPALLPEFQGEWSLSNTRAGWISGVYFAAYAAAVPVLASLTDRVDARSVYRAGTALAVAAALGFALLARGFWSALLFRVLGGFALAGTFMPGLKALVDRVPAAARHRAVTYYTAAFGLGTSLSFYAAGELGRALGWRWAFAVSAAGAVIALAIASAVLRPQPPPPRVTSGLLDFRPVLRNRRAAGHILAYAAHTWELFAFRSWAVVFLAASASLTPGGPSTWSPTTVVAVGGLVATAVNMCAGELALRFGRRTVATWIMLASLLLGCLLGFTVGLPYPLVAALCVLYNLLVQADSSALHAGTVDSAEPTRLGSTMALQSLLGFATASAAPLAVGMALDATRSLGAPLHWAAGFAMMAGVASLGPLFLRWAEQSPPAPDSTSP